MDPPKSLEKVADTLSQKEISTALRKNNTLHTTSVVDYLASLSDQHTMEKKVNNKRNKVC